MAVPLDPAEELVPEHEHVLAVRRDAEVALGDLPVGAADADLERPHRHLALAHRLLRDVGDARRLRLAGRDDERLHQAAVRPPSTTSTVPVANSAETRYSTASAISSVVPSRPRGCRARSASSDSPDLLDEAPHPRRVDGAGADGVDPDPVGDVVDRERTRQRDDGALRGAVGSAVAEADQRRDRGDVHDRAAAAGRHVRDRVLAAEERPARVDREDVLPDLERRVGRVRRRADPGDVDEHVDAHHRRRHLLLVAHVELHGACLRAELGSDLLDRFQREVGGDHLGALRRKPSSYGRSDPGARTGDESGLADRRRLMRPSCPD